MPKWQATIEKQSREETFTFLLGLYPYFVATPRGEHMCSEREENGIFWGLMLKPSMVTTRNCNIIFKISYLFFICLGQTYPLIQQKGSIFTNFPL
jgi:hypothetical protein